MHILNTCINSIFRWWSKPQRKLATISCIVKVRERQRVLLENKAHINDWFISGQELYQTHYTSIHQPTLHISTICIAMKTLCSALPLIIGIGRRSCMTESFSIHKFIFINSLGSIICPLTTQPQGLEWPPWMVAYLTSDIIKHQTTI